MTPFLHCVLLILQGIQKRCLVSKEGRRVSMRRDGVRVRNDRKLRDSAKTNSNK